MAGISKPKPKPAKKAAPAASPKPLDAGLPEARALTPKQFSVRYGISVPSLYKLWSEGRGPRWYYNDAEGGSRRITPEAGDEWQKERERVAAEKGEG